MIISWKVWKLTYPYICRNCGQTHYSKVVYCAFCGKKETVREVIKKDYKIWKLLYK